LGNINQFFSACTNCNIEKPNSIQLTGFTVDEEHGELPFLAEKILERTRNIFGQGVTSPVSYQYPQNIPSKQTQTEWDLTNCGLTNALNFMIAGQPWPKYNLGQVELILSYHFKLIYPLSRIELPNQPFNSNLLIWLSRNNAISPMLAFLLKMQMIISGNI